MKHHNYADKENMTIKLDEKASVNITLSTVGAQPSKVAATWVRTGGKTGIAYGGFQNRKDFDFQVAAMAAVENAIEQARA